MKSGNVLAGFALAASLGVAAAGKGNAAPTLPTDAQSTAHGTAPCLDINGEAAGSLTVHNRSFGLLELPVKGVFTAVGYRGTIDHIEFVDVLTDDAGNGSTAQEGFFVPLDADAGALVVTLLPENSKMVCRIPDRAPR